jgi:MFS-type transporter involved in bile tolerance (Atg22 family)
MLPKFVIMIALFMSTVAAISGIIMMFLNKNEMGKPLAYIGVISGVAIGALYGCTTEDEVELEYEQV